MNIGEASKQSGLSERMIRHYEEIGLVPQAARKSSGYRYFKDDDVQKLRFIRLCRDFGFPIEEIGKLLTLWGSRGQLSPEVKMLALARAVELRFKAAEADETRELLEDLATGRHRDNRATS